MPNITARSLRPPRLHNLALLLALGIWLRLPDRAAKSTGQYIRCCCFTGLRHCVTTTSLSRKPCTRPLICQSSQEICLSGLELEHARRGVLVLVWRWAVMTGGACPDLDVWCTQSAGFTWQKLEPRAFFTQRLRPTAPRDSQPRMQQATRACAARCRAVRLPLAVATCGCRSGSRRQASVASAATGGS